MSGSHTSDDGSATGEQPNAGATANSPPIPAVTAPLPTTPTARDTPPLPLTVPPLGASSADAASSSTAPPPSIHSVNIGAHIDFKLDVVCGNYSKWRRIMSFVLRKSGVESHVLVNLDSLTQTAQWRQDDLQIHLTIYGTITDELYDILSAQDSTAYHAWFLLDAFFRDNLAGRAIHVGAEFCATVQGDMKIAEYCRRLKALTDSLDDLDEHITDKTLTLQLIRGLATRFSVMASLLPMQVPFPTFVQARSRLRLEELSQAARARTEGATTLIATHGGSYSSSGPGGSSGGGGGSSSTGGVLQRQPDRPSDRGGHGRGSRGRGGRGSTPTPPGVSQQPWMGYFAPWGAPFPSAGRIPCVPPNAAGVLGPRPGAPHHAYPMVYSAPPTYGAAPPPPS
ncbi:Sulfotransferase 17 [Hordeum vulgare]|nr:Sulfotransferase 17 [Hordeum vulgare]